MSNPINLYTINMGLADGKLLSQSHAESMVEYILTKLDPDLAKSLKYNYIDIPAYPNAEWSQEELNKYNNNKAENRAYIGSIVFLQEISYYSHLKFNQLLNKTKFKHDRYFWAVQTSICNMDNPNYYDPVTKKYKNFNNIYINEADSTYSYGYESLPLEEQQQLSFNGIIISSHFIMQNNSHEYNKCIIPDSYINIFKTYRSTGLIPLIHKPTNIVLYVNSIHSSVKDTTQYNSISQTCYINDLYNKRFSNVIFAGDWNYNKFKSSIQHLYNTPAYHYEDKTDDNYKSLKWLSDTWELFDISPQECTKNYCKNKYDYIFATGINIYIDTNTTKPASKSSASESFCKVYYAEDSTADNTKIITTWDHEPIKKTIKLSLKLDHPDYGRNIIDYANKNESLDCNDFKKIIYECMYAGINFFQNKMDLKKTTQFIVFNPAALLDPQIPKIDASNMGDFSAVYEAQGLNSENKYNKIIINCNDNRKYFRNKINPPKPSPIPTKPPLSSEQKKPSAWAASNPATSLFQQKQPHQKGGIFNSIFVQFILQ